MRMAGMLSAQPEQCLTSFFTKLRTRTKNSNSIHLILNARTLCQSNELLSHVITSCIVITRVAASDLNKTNQMNVF